MSPAQIQQVIEDPGGLAGIPAQKHDHPGTPVRPHHGVRLFRGIRAPQGLGCLRFGLVEIAHLGERDGQLASHA